jgi:hypothetical protein
MHDPRWVRYSPAPETTGAANRHERGTRAEACRIDTTSTEGEECALDAGIQLQRHTAARVRS